MAQKESSHREIVDKLKAELSQVQRQHDELTVLSRDQVRLVSDDVVSTVFIYRAADFEHVGRNGGPPE